MSSFSHQPENELCDWSSEAIFFPAWFYPATLTLNFTIQWATLWPFPHWQIWSSTVQLLPAEKFPLSSFLTPLLHSLPNDALTCHPPSFISVSCGSYETDYKKAKTMRARHEGEEDWRSLEGRNDGWRTWSGSGNYMQASGCLWVSMFGLLFSKPTTSVELIVGSISEIANAPFCNHSSRWLRQHTSPRLCIEGLLHTGKYLSLTNQLSRFLNIHALHIPTLIYHKLPQHKWCKEFIQLYYTPPSFGAMTSHPSRGTQWNSCPHIFSSRWCIKPNIKCKVALREIEEHEDGQYQYRHQSRDSQWPNLDSEWCGTRPILTVFPNCNWLIQLLVHWHRETYITMLVCRLLPAVNFSLHVLLQPRYCWVHFNKQVP
jgi:hypothetical protein